MDVCFRLRVLVLVLGVTLFGSRALAQSDDERAAARSTATAGLQAIDEERWADAAALFGRAEQLVHAPPHLLYYARASVKLGKLVQANEAYVKILRETLPPNAPKAFLDAHAAAAAEQPKVEQSLPRLTVVVEGNLAKDAHVTVNDAELPHALVGISAPHDPGDLVLEAIAPGWRSEKAKLTLQEGARETVTLKLSIRDANARPAPIEGTVKVAAAKPGLRVAGWISIGIGVVGLGAGTYFLIDNRNNREAANALCALPNNVCPASQRSAIQSFDSAANTSEILSWIGYGVGGVGVVMGVVMLVLSRGKSEPPPKAAVVQPWFGPGSIGLSGSF